jgi:putative phosphoribosyl transferase
MGKILDDPALRNRTYVFADRAAAGKRLAAMLLNYRGQPLRLFAIPAGGVPVGAEIARVLDAPLDLVIVRKIQLPWTTEAGFGALDPDGVPIFNEDLLRRQPLAPKEIAAQVAKTLASLREREVHLRGGRPYADLEGAPTIIVDDGLASGYTMRAAVRFLKGKGAGLLIVAVPTALDRTAQALLPLVDLLVCPNLRGGLSFAVAEAYENWYDIDQTEVLEVLADLGQP